MSPCSPPVGVAGQRLGEHGALDLRPAPGPAGRRRRAAARRAGAGSPAPPASTTPASFSTGSMSGRALERVGALGAGRLEHGDEVGPAVGGRDRRLRRLAHDGEDRALDRPHHRLVGRRGRGRQRGGRARRRRRRRARPRRRRCPRRICERITPELPRAPMSEPWLIALQTAAEVAVGAVELLAHRS